MPQPLSLPFAHLNLRRNPFGELTQAERKELVVFDFDVTPLIERLQTPRFAAQFLGEAGRGKSTHLLGLHRTFPDAPFFYLAESAPPLQLAQIPDAPVIFIDELQRMPQPQRLALFRRPTSFVIGTHQDHEAEYLTASLMFENFHLSGITPQRLQRILTRRIEHAVRDRIEPIPVISLGAAEALVKKFGDDIRSTENYLYTVFQTSTSLSDARLRLANRL